MTTANLMNVPSVNGKFAAQVETSKKLQDEDLKVAAAFAGLMNQTVAVSNQVVDDTSSNMDVKVDSTQSVAESYERYSYQDKQIDSAETSNVNETLEEACDVHGIDVEEILEKLDFSKKIIFMTAHRRENLGEPLKNICEAVKEEITFCPNAFSLLSSHILFAISTRYAIAVTFNITVKNSLFIPERVV